MDLISLETVGTNLIQAEDLDENFKPKPISAELIKELKEEAIDAKILFDKFEQEFFSDDNYLYCILSKRWLNKWKQYVSYDEVTLGRKPNSQYFGQIKPGVMNEDLVVYPEFIIKYPGIESFANVFVKDQLRPGIDYVIVPEDLWNEFKSKYNGKEIKRPVILQDGQKTLEFHLKSFDLVFVTNEFFRNVDHLRVKKFTAHRVQVSPKKTINDFKKDLISVLKSNCSRDYLSAFHRRAELNEGQLDNDNVRVWQLDSQFSLEIAFDYFKDICNKTKSYDYKILFKGEYLEKYPEKKIEETNLSETDTVFVEIRSLKEIGTLFIRMPLLLISANFVVSMIC